MKEVSPPKLTNINYNFFHSSFLKYKHILCIYFPQICPFNHETTNQKGYISPSAFENNPTHLVIQSSSNVRTYKKVTSKVIRSYRGKAKDVENSFSFNKVNPILCGKYIHIHFFLFVLLDINLSFQNRHIAWVYQT